MISIPPPHLSTHDFNYCHIYDQAFNIVANNFLASILLRSLITFFTFDNYIYEENLKLISFTLIEFSMSSSKYCLKH